MRAIVTGSNGFVGPHLTEHLETLGDEVVALTQQSGPDLNDAPGWVKILQEVQPTVVYHLAGWSDVGGSWDHPERAVHLNALGTFFILDAARQCDPAPRVIVVSSADVYGTVDPESLPLTEDAPIQPRSPYGASKQAAEAFAQQSFRGFGLETIVARPFNHIGPGQATKFIAPSFACQIATAEQHGGGTISHGDLTPQRDVTDVRDIVRAYRLLASDGKPGETYNICSGSTVTMQEILDLLTSRSKVPIRTETNPDLLRPVELPVLKGDSSKLTEATGWEPSLHLDTTLTDILQDARHRVIRQQDSGENK